jgi:predicted NACHT family NTPase
LRGYDVLDKLMAGWRFDIRSAVVTLLLAPVLLMLLSIIRRYLKAWSSYILEGWMYWLSRLFNRTLAGSLTLRRYCRLRLAEENRYLYVPSRQDVKLQVDEAYVPLTLEQQGTQCPTYTHRDILTTSNRIRVVGDPGSGKSSLVKRLFRDTCYQALAKPSQGKLPILIELKHLAIPEKLPKSRMGAWLVGKLREEACQNRVYKMGECFDTYAEGAGLVIFLDGLDEVSTSNYDRVRAAIAD